MMRRAGVLFAVFVAWMLLVAVVAVVAAHAANRPSPQLNAAASSIAGHSVSVWCETDWPAYLSLAQQHGVTEAKGFTVIGTPVVYLAPDVCEYLWAIMEGRDVGSFFAADGILTLAHESVHQRGITNEGVTDCTALGLVKEVATTFFGVPKTVTKQVVTHVWRKIGTKRVRVPALVTRSVTNPYLSRLVSDARLWHEAKGATYAGACS